MRAQLQKPLNWSIKRFMHRVLEINSLLPLFPPFNAANKMDDSECNSIIENALLEAWKRELILKEVDVSTLTPAAFLTTLESIEQAEAHLIRKRALDQEQKHEGTKRQKTTQDKKLYCHLCGENNTHKTADCFILAKLKKQKNEKNNSKEKITKKIISTSNVVRSWMNII